MNTINSVKRDLDLGDQQIVRQILLYGSEQEIAQLQEYQGLTDQQIRDYKKFARLQNEITERCETASELRWKKNPAPTSEELSMGAYLESLEPQVRDAVRTLRRKGYNTYSSGFQWLDTQVIMYAEIGQALDLPFELREDLYKKGVLTVISNKEVQIKSKFMSIEAFKSVWNAIAQAMPDLNKESEQSMIGPAIQFRKRFGF